MILSNLLQLLQQVHHSQFIQSQLNSNSERVAKFIQGPVCVTKQLKEEQLFFMTSEIKGVCDLPVNRWPWWDSDSKKGQPTGTPWFKWTWWRKIQIYKVKLVDIRKRLTKGFLLIASSPCALKIKFNLKLFYLFSNCREYLSHFSTLLN